jgi:hypothetical protein
MGVRPFLGAGHPIVLRSLRIWVRVEFTKLKPCRPTLTDPLHHPDAPHRGLHFVIRTLPVKSTLSRIDHSSVARRYRTVGRNPAAGSDGGIALTALFLLPIASLYQVRFIGEMNGTELAFLLVLPALWLTHGTRAVAPGIRLTLWMLGAWFVVQIATDFYRDSYIGDYLRGWAKLTFFAIDIYVIARLLTTERRLFAWTAGWNVAVAATAWNQFEDVAVRWKFGVALAAVSFALAVALLIAPRSRIAVTRMAALLSLAMATASLFLNARSTFLSLLVSGALLAIAGFQGSRSVFLSASRRIGILLLAVTLVSAYVIGLAYVQGVESGAFGEEAMRKFNAQRSDASDPVLAVLTGGRDEFYATSEAISDSPVIGFGSWARSSYYFSLFAEQIRAHGTPEQIRELDSQVTIGEPLIPSHSHLLGAWVEAGVVGAAFWGLLLWRAIRAVPRAMALQGNADVLILATLPMFVWNILFSPFGGEMRLVEAIAIIVVLFPATVPRGPSLRPTRAAFAPKT